MFDLWADKNEPTLRLVTRAGSGLPVDLGPRDWLMIGSTDPDAETVAKVDALGYHFFRSDEPLADAQALKNSGATGA